MYNRLLINANYLQKSLEYKWFHVSGFMFQVTDFNLEP